ncbi:MAG: hypothetical protein WC359_14240 [Dehalococcoidia bacterium]|jgi:hypothetical protein
MAKIGDHYTAVNPQPIIRCEFCGQDHAAGEVNVTCTLTRMGWVYEMDRFDCPNPPMNYRGGGRDAGIKWARDAQAESDKRFNAGFKPYGF